jgi:hypothetical protein
MCRVNFDRAFIEHPLDCGAAEQTSNIELSTSNRSSIRARRWKFDVLISLDRDSHLAG